MSHGKHRSKGRSKKKREQELKYDVTIWTEGGMFQAGGWYKSLGTAREKVHSGGRGAAMFVRESFVKAEIKKRQADGSWKLVETITELDP
jgi:hypothetical protein